MGRIYYNSNGILLENDKPIYTPTSPLLTYPGSTHTEEEVIALGGSVWTTPYAGDSSDTTTGKTIGVFYQDYNHSTLDMPTGWSIATGVNGRWEAIRYNLIYKDYCDYQFADYSGESLDMGLWPNTKVGYAGGTYYNRYVSCAAVPSLSPRGDYWVIYYSDAPYTVRVLYKTTWILGTNSTYGHAGHEIAQFGAY